MRSELAIYPCHRIIKKVAGKRLRVSEKAAEELAGTLEEIGQEIAGSALNYCFHSRRITLQATDIAIAAERMKQKWQKKIGEVVAHCLLCHWEGSIDKLKRVQEGEMVCLVCPECEGEDFELEENEEKIK